MDRAKSIFVNQTKFCAYHWGNLSTLFNRTLKKLTCTEMSAWNWSWEQKYFETWITLPPSLLHSSNSGAIFQTRHQNYFSLLSLPLGQIYIKNFETHLVSAWIYHSPKQIKTTSLTKQLTTINLYSNPSNSSASDLRIILNEYDL